MAVYDTQGRPVIVDIETAYTAGVQGIGVSTLGNTAGNTGTSAGVVVLAGSNNLSLSQSTDGAGITVWMQQTGAGAADGVNIVSLSGNTSGTLTTQSTGTVVLAGGANITLSQSSNSITIVGGAGGAGAAISAGTESQSTGTVVFSNSNGISFGLNAGTLTASHNALTTAAATNHSHGNPTLNLTNLSGTTASNSGGLTLSLSAGNYLTTAAASDHTHSQYAGTAGAITGGSITVNTSGVSVALPAYLTTARASNDAIGLNTAATQVTWTVNSSGISLNAGAYLTTAQPPGAYLTTAMASDASTNFAGVGETTGTTSGTDLKLTVDTAGVNVSFPKWLTTAMASDAGSAFMATGERGNYFYTSNNTFANQTHSHGNPTLALTNLTGTTASASNGLTISLSANPAGGADGYNIVSASGNTSGTLTSFTTGTIVLAGGNNITLSQSSNSITISGANVGGAQTGISGIGASNTTFTSGTVIWSGQNNVTVGTSVDGASQYVRLSVGNYLTTAAASDHSHGNPTLALTNLTGTTASGSNGLTLSISAGNYLTTAAASDHTHSQYAGTAGAITGGSITVNTSGVSVALPAYLTTAAASNHSHSLNEILDPSADKVFQIGTNHLQFQYAGGGTFSTNASRQGLFEIDANVALTDGADVVHIHNTLAPAVMDMVHIIGAGTGVTLLRLSAGASVAAEINAPLKFTGGSVPLVLGTSQSNSVANLNANYLQGKVSSEFQSTGNYLTTAAQSNQVVNSLNGSTGQVSLATGSSLSSSQNGSTITFGLASNITTALQSAGAYLTTAANSTHTHGSGPSITGPISVTSNSSAWSISVSNYITTARASTDAVGLNTAATNVTWTVNSGGLSLNAAGYAGTGTSGTNVTMTLDSAGLALSVAAPGAALENNWINLSGNTAGNTTASGSTIKWYGGANITLHGTNGSEVSIIGGAGGGGAAIGLSTLGNTAGNTKTWSSGTVVLAGSSSMTISQSTDANGGTLWLQPAMSQLAAGNLVSLSSNGSTVSIINVLSSSAIAQDISSASAAGTLSSRFALADHAHLGVGGFGASNVGSTAGNTGTKAGTWVLAGSNSITVSAVTGAGGVNTLYIQQTGGGGGGVAMGVSNTGNTAGNTGTYSTGTFVFAGSNSMTLSQSTGGASVHTIWMLPLLSALSGGGGISLSTTGSTIVIYTV